VIVKPPHRVVAPNLFDTCLIGFPDIGIEESSVAPYGNADMSITRKLLLLSLLGPFLLSGCTNPQRPYRMHCQLSSACDRYFNPGSSGYSQWRCIEGSCVHTSDLPDTW
jgi:hypothetical protein